MATGLWGWTCAAMVMAAAGAVVAARVRAVGLGVRVHRLRGDVYDATLTGALPSTGPVQDLLAAVEHVAEHHRRMRLVDLVAFDVIDRYVRWRHRHDAVAPLAGVRLVPVLAVVGAPVRVWGGLDEGEAARLAVFRARFDGLVAQLTLTTSWSGLAVIAWFMAAGLRGPRAAVAAADRSRVGRAARRGVMQTRPTGLPPWFT